MHTRQSIFGCHIDNVYGGIFKFGIIRVDVWLNFFLNDSIN
jgi:hypothetical protein